MAAKKPEVLEDELTFVQAPKEEKHERTVQIYLPKLEEEGNGVKVDQYEHVTIANEDKEETIWVKRGERVDIPIRFYIVMKEKYPDL
jgi:hypothetical protein